jgi:hypothetical protein
MFSLFLYGFLAVVGILCVAMAYLGWKRARSPLRNIPGPPLPHPIWLSIFLGNFDVWNNLSSDMAHLREKYGGLIRYSGIGQAGCVLALDTGIVRDVLVQRPELFPKDDFQKSLGQWITGPDALGNTVGDCHARLRRVVLKFFELDNLELALPMIVSKTTIQMNIWKAAADASASHTVHVEGNEAMAKLTLDMIGLTAAGADFGAITGADNKIYDTYQSMYGMFVCCYVVN